MDLWLLNVVNKEEVNMENLNSITNYSFVLYLKTLLGEEEVEVAGAAAADVGIDNGDFEVE